MATATTIIESALRKIGALSRGFSLSSEDAADGLEALNDLLQHWSNESLVIPYRTRESLTLTSGTNPHTIGIGGTLSTTRPLVIESAQITVSGIDYPVDVITLGEYQRIPDKTSTGRPLALYYEPSDTLGRIYFDYVPDSTYPFVLHSLKPLTSFTALATDDSLPEEYLRMVKFNLAVDLAPEYHKEVPATVAAMAASSLAAVKARNNAFRVGKLAVDAALLKGPYPGRSINNPR